MRRSSCNCIWYNLFRRIYRWHSKVSEPKGQLGTHQCGSKICCWGSITMDSIRALIGCPIWSHFSRMRIVGNTSASVKSGISSEDTKSITLSLSSSSASSFTGAVTAGGDRARNCVAHGSREDLQTRKMLVCTIKKKTSIHC